MIGSEKQQRQLAVVISNNANQSERDALLRWSAGLLAIKGMDVSASKKAKEAIQLTVKSKIVIPVAKLIGKEVKRHAWDERGTKSRFGLIGAGTGLVLFGGQGAGIAALGTAIGVPLWIVLGAGATFAGMLVEELSLVNGEKPVNPITSYTVIDAEKDENN